MQGSQGIGGDEFGLQVRQWRDATIGARARVIHPLLHRKADKAAQLGDLNGDGLDVHAMQAALDQEELSRVVGVVAAFELGVEICQRRLGTLHLISAFRCGRYGIGLSHAALVV